MPNCPHIRPAVVIATLFSCAIACPVGAQQVPPQGPVYTASDINDVNLTSGSPNFRVSDLSIGSAGNELSHTFFSIGANVSNLNNDSFDGYLGGANGQIPTHSMEFGGQAEIFFPPQNGIYPSANGRGSTLIDNGNGTWTYTLRDGTVLTIDSSLGNGSTFLGRVSIVKYPDGRVLNIHRNPTDKRVRSVTRSDGFQFKYNYNGAQKLTSIVAINNAFEYCAPSADTCSLTMTWPSASYAVSGSVVSITDQLGGVTRFTMDSVGRVTGVKWPTSSSADNITYTYCDNSCFVIGQGYSYVFPNMVMGVVRNGQSWTYNFAAGSGFSFSYYSSINPIGGETEAELASAFVPFTTFVSPLKTLWTDDDRTFYFDPTSYSGRANSVSVGISAIGYTYDSRGNVTQVREHARAGSPDATIVTDAGYDQACSNPITCNKGNWVRDGRGNQTDYTYSPSHGGVLTVTGPAVNGIRPQTRYAYMQRYAWTKNASGAYVKSTAPIWVLTQESYCRTSAAMGNGCAVANDEVKTTFDYGPDVGPNNLFLRGKAITADGQTLRTCYAYDRFGNKISETLPRASLSTCP